MNGEAEVSEMNVQQCLGKETRVTAREGRERKAEHREVREGLGMQTAVG